MEVQYYTLYDQYATLKIMYNIVITIKIILNLNFLEIKKVLFVFSHSSFYYNSLISEQNQKITLFYQIIITI